MDNTWIKLHRKFLVSAVWKYAIQTHNENLIKLWLFLLLTANWEEKKWYDGKKEIIIQSGSLVSSLKHLSEGAVISVQQTRTCLKHLENMQMITRNTTNKWTQVWIVNWDKYQMQDNSNNMRSNKRLTNEQQTTNKRLTTTKEYKNIRNKEYRERDNSSLAYLRNIPLDDINDFLLITSATERQIWEKGLSLIDYCESHGKTYKNYKALLRNSLRKDYPKKEKVELLSNLI